jgi:hypothetical protein
MMDCAEENEIDTALIFATMKGINDDDDLCQWHWIKEGLIQTNADQAA